MKIDRVLLLIVAACISQINGYNILGIFHSISKSHYFVGSALMKELAARGHQVTTVAPFRLNPSVENYTELIIDGILETTKNVMANLMELRDSSPINRLTKLYSIGEAMTEATFKEAVFQDLLSSDKRFDLIIIDTTMNDAFMGLGHLFKAPIAALTTIGATMWTCDLVGTPAPLSFIPYPFVPLTDSMSYRERLTNVVLTTAERLYYNFIFMPTQEKLYNENFADPKPNLQDLRKNVSLVLLNSHYTLHYPRPLVPNMIEVGGMQVNRKRSPLPENIAAFIDSATDGLVYFSMGSNIRCDQFSRETLDGLIRVFGSLKEKVIWKCERAISTKMAGNVLTSDWLPQDDILAHPNVKLFITHGGLLSTTEAIYHGVPILGIPGFADQFQNMAFAIRSGFAVQLDFDELAEVTFREALHEVLSNPKYAENAKIASRRYRDQPLTPLNTAVYWIEYVIRHKGAAHMRIRAQDLSFMEYHSVDTIGGLIGLILVFGFIIMKLVKKVCLILIISYFNWNVKEKAN